MTQALLMSVSEELPGPRAEFRDPKATVKFMLAGNAHVTFQSERTGTRFTYHVALGERAIEFGRIVHLVSVLTGPDHYTYLGCIFDRRDCKHGEKSHIDRRAPSALAFRWVWRELMRGKMHPQLAVWHEGRCGKCGRRLTTPESIASGLGPVCGGRP